MNKFEKVPVNEARNIDQLLDMIGRLDSDSSAYEQERDEIINQIKKLRYAQAEGLDKSLPYDQSSLIENFEKYAKSELAENPTGLISSETVQSIIKQFETVQEIDKAILEYFDWKYEIEKEGGLYDEEAKEKISAEDAGRQIEQIIQALREKREQLRQGN